MNILYVILTCEAYFPTRCQLVKETWLRDVDPKNYLFLSAKEDMAQRKIGYNTPDDYKNAPLKYFHFLRNFDFTGYDWVFFADDDTYCFRDRLISNIRSGNLNPEENICMCQVHPDKQYGFWSMCGGAGILVSKEAIQRLKRYLHNHPTPPLYDYTDVSLARWMIDTETKLIHNDLMVSQPHDNHAIKADLFNGISFHYCKEYHFRFLDKLARGL